MLHCHRINATLALAKANESDATQNVVLSSDGRAIAVHFVNSVKVHTIVNVSQNSDFSSVGRLNEP